MNKITKLIHVFFLTFIFVCLFSTQTLLASTSIPFEYNVIPIERNNSIIDTKSQKELQFKLYEPTKELYYNNKLIPIVDNLFSINISKLSGENTLTFINEENHEVSFTYFFSDKKGKVKDYELIKDKKLTTYVTTYKNIKIIYTNKENSAPKKVISYLKKLPANLLESIDTITLIPFETTTNVAGVASGNNITLYKFSKYSASTQKNILYHEIAHIWSNRLIDNKLIDYSYTTYSNAVNKDNNFVSNYSKTYIIDKNKYNEDFADSVAFFFMNQRSFRKKYPYRFEYINNLVKLKIEKDDETTNN